MFGNPPSMTTDATFCPLIGVSDVVIVLLVPLVQPLAAGGGGGGADPPLFPPQPNVRLNALNRTTVKDLRTLPPDLFSCGTFRRIQFPALTVAEATRIFVHLRHR
jgi:hypothetical protein